MTGETDLATLLQTLAPELAGAEYVFCTFEGAKYGDHLHLEPIAAMLETEGLTLVVPRTRADAANLPYSTTYRCITLNVHSSLDAVGLTAAFATKLTDKGISANVWAGYFHDHLFVNARDAERALDALRELSSDG